MLCGKYSDKLRNKSDQYEDFIFIFYMKRNACQTSLNKKHPQNTMRKSWKFSRRYNDITVSY